MTNDALKPCPFCGSEKILIYKKFFKVDCPDAEMETHKKVKCDGCGIGTEWYYDTRFGTAEENARNAWNARHPTQKNGCCDIDPDRCAGMCELLAIIKAALAPVDGNTSDGYHTFNELYEHRHALFLTICRIYKDRAWKSKFHSDGTMFDGWFIAGIATTDGQATYHLPLRLWDDFTVSELPMAPPWDGHTPDDVTNRIKNLAALTKPKADVEGLANYIRAINGDNTMGAGELAEKITDYLAARGCFGVAEGYALVPLSDLPPSIFIPLPEGRVLGETQKIESIVSIEDAYKIAQCLIKAMLKAAPKKEGRNE